MIHMVYLSNAIFKIMGDRRPPERCRQHPVADSGGAAKSADGRQLVQPDRVDPGNTADRHREEELHHDDRLCAGSGKQTAPQPSRGDPSGLLAALQADVNDYHGGAAADAGLRRRTATAAGAGDCRLLS